MEIQEKLHFILQNIEKSRAVVRAAYSIRHQLVESAINGRITEREFYTITSLLSSQSRSPIWERYFREKYGGRKVHKDENRGELSYLNPKQSIRPFYTRFNKFEKLNEYVLLRKHPENGLSGSFSTTVSSLPSLAPMLFSILQVD